ncbi:unnamed protein product [Amoebophrya sp. A25]|nr:unnamed protein product [Amoebophrya sp. A25]|eukprot:GSA25T00022386001.1
MAYWWAFLTIVISMPQRTCLLVVSLVVTCQLVLPARQLASVEGIAIMAWSAMWFGSRRPWPWYLGFLRDADVCHLCAPEHEAECLMVVTARR